MCGTKGALSDIGIGTPAAQAIPIFHYHPVMWPIYHYPSNDYPIWDLILSIIFRCRYSSTSEGEITNNHVTSCKPQPLFRKTCEYTLSHERTWPCQSDTVMSCKVNLNKFIYSYRHLGLCLLAHFCYNTGFSWLPSIPCVFHWKLIKRREYIWRNPLTKSALNKVQRCN